MDIALFAAGCALITILPLVVDFIFSRRRVRMLRQEAHKLGFSFQDNGNPFQGSDVQGLTVLEEDPAALTLHVMQGRVGPCEALIFDLGHYIPGHENLVETTIAGFRCPSRHIPVFQMGEKGFAHRLCDLLQQKTDLELGGACKDRFVHCADPAGSSKFLTAETIAGLPLPAEHFRVESSHDWILVYRPGRKAAPQALGQFLQTTSAIAAALLGRSAPQVCELADAR